MHNVHKLVIILFLFFCSSSIQAQGSNDTIRLIGTTVINEAYSLPKDAGSANQYLFTDGNGNISWKYFISGPPLPSSIIIDNDGDTYVDVESTSDEDLIRFFAKGKEVLTLDSAHIQTPGSGNSVFIGVNAGINDDLSNNKNTAIGNGALQNNVSLEGNTAIGFNALIGATGGYDNTAIGSEASSQNVTGDKNVVIGAGALQLATSGDRSVIIGTDAAYSAQQVNSSVIIGERAGFNGDGSTSGNIFIGSEAGYNEMSSNKLYIDNSNTSSPLIYGDFSANELTINSKLIVDSVLEVKNRYIFPTEAPSFNDVLVAHDAEGTLKWKSKSEYVNTIIKEADGKYNVEALPTSVRVKIDGESFTFETTSLDEPRISPSTDNVIMGRNAGNAIDLNSDNVIIGEEAGQNADGGSNTYIGAQAGQNNLNGGANVFLGRGAGQNSTASNRLIIESGTGLPLIEGDFTDDSLYVNGSLTVNKAYTLPIVSGNMDQVLTTDGSGGTSWQDASGGIPSKIQNGSDFAEIVDSKLTISMDATSHNFHGNGVQLNGQVHLNSNLAGLVSIGNYSMPNALGVPGSVLMGAGFGADWSLYGFPNYTGADGDILVLQGGMLQWQSQAPPSGLIDDEVKNIKADYEEILLRSEQQQEVIELQNERIRKLEAQITRIGEIEERLSKLSDLKKSN